MLPSGMSTSLRLIFSSCKTFTSNYIKDTVRKVRFDRFSNEGIHLAMHSTSTRTSFGSLATSTADLAGAWFPKNLE